MTAREMQVPVEHPRLSPTPASKPLSEATEGMQEGVLSQSQVYVHRAYQVAFAPGQTTAPSPYSHFHNGRR